METPKNMYIGSRYVPKHEGTWDNTTNTAYEALSVVLWQGNSFTSKVSVPKGIDILNETFWVKSADYNAQLAIYQNDLAGYHTFLVEQLGIVTTISEAMDAMTTSNNAFTTTVNNTLANNTASTIALINTEVTSQMAGTVTTTLASVDARIATNTSNTIALIATDDADNSKKIPHLGTTTNVVDAYSITTLENIAVNQKFTIKINAPSVATPTLKINTGSAYPIKKANGNASKLYASVYTLFWDGTNFTQLGEGGDYGTAGATQTLTGYTLGTDSGVIAGTMPNKIASATVITPSTVAQAIPQGYYGGALADGQVSIQPSNIKSIQRGTASILAGDLTKAITISSIITSNSIIKVILTDTNNNPMYKFFSGVITNATTITLARNTSGTAETVIWEIVEFNNVKSKQIGTTSTFGAITISNIDPLKSQIFMSATSTLNPGSGNFLYELFSCNIVSATSIQIYDGCAGTAYWQVIEFN